MLTAKYNLKKLPSVPAHFWGFPYMYHLSYVLDLATRLCFCSLDHGGDLLCGFGPLWQGCAGYSHGIAAHHSNKNHWYIARKNHHCRPAALKPPPPDRIISVRSSLSARRVTNAYTDILEIFLQFLCGSPYSCHVEHMTALAGHFLAMILA